METLPSAAERQQLVSSFLEIAAGQTADVAAQFLEATGWKLDEAVQLFYVSKESGGVESSFLPQQINGITSEADIFASRSSVQGALEDEVRAPLPVIRNTLYEETAFFRSQPSLDVPSGISRHSSIWELSESIVSTSNGTGGNLASLYTPPFALMFQGRFDQVKVVASLHGKWLLVNLQSHEEFNSHMLNRDTWANEAVAQTIHSNFVFWQEYHSTTEGKKVCTYYNLLTLPAVLLIDPITGQKMHAWTGMVHPERLLEELLPFLDKGPKEHHDFLRQKQRQRAAHDSAVNVAGKEAMKDDVEMVTDEESRPETSPKTNSNDYPPLLEEPEGSKGLCRVAIRLPDGRRLQRKFLLTDSIELLWSFCSSNLEDGLKRPPFHFIQFILGASRTLEYEKDMTFEAAGLSNSMISLVWD